ncbi:MAG TPA: hypothetical protein VL326_37030 [Kofleriaceae bacterium]|nr:hypothetical protein [Kofleriaceae bacterium]
MRRCWLCLGVLAGCGRFGFSQRSGGDAAVETADTASSDAGICHTGTFGPPQLIANTATISEESAPSISADELTLYFVSNRGPSQMRAIWQTTRVAKTDAFGPPVIVPQIDSSVDDGEPDISDDGLTIYYWSVRAGQPGVIYSATRATTSDTFVDQGALQIIGDTSSTTGPQISADELTLFYASSQLEIAYATRLDRSSPFSFARETDEVNSAPTDSSPSLTADGLELFFESYRTGPAVIYRATRASTADVFSAPVALVELAAGNPDAGAPDISRDGRTLYYFINDGTQIDLYSATRDCL